MNEPRSDRIRGAFPQWRCLGDEGNPSFRGDATDGFGRGGNNFGGTLAGGRSFGGGRVSGGGGTATGEEPVLAVI